MTIFHNWRVELVSSYSHRCPFVSQKDWTLNLLKIENMLQLIFTFNFVSSWIIICIKVVSAVSIKKHTEASCSNNMIEKSECRNCLWWINLKVTSSLYFLLNQSPWLTGRKKIFKSVKFMSMGAKIHRNAAMVLYKCSNCVSNFNHKLFRYIKQLVLIFGCFL